ncbi:MAG: hypothetical protein GC205_05900 [Bacteroidetes bacterium]|nr:hypothetical protein [Bacteroidota bacterium]
MMRQLSAVFLLLLASIVQAQDSAGVQKPVGDGSIELFEPATPRKQEKAKLQGIVYSKEFSMGGKITTTGWGFFGEYSRTVSSTKKRVFSFEFMELKHPKQIKQSNEFILPAFGLESPKAYVYGKQNNLYLLHTGYGGRYMLGDRAKKSGVEVSMSWSAGPTFGLLKPYYLKVIETNGDFFTIQDKRFDPDEPEDFLNQAAIYGASGFSYGLGQLDFVPGAHGKVGLNFDWANYSEVVKSLEAGIGADLFLGRPEIMIVERNKFQFVYLYLSLQFGKRW